MNDDFNTPVAVAVLFELAGEVNRTRSPQTAALAARRWAATLGVLQQAPRSLPAGAAAALDEAASPTPIAARARPRQARDFARGRPHPRGAAGAGHRAQGLRPGHDLGEGLTHAPSAARMAGREPQCRRHADYWDDACKHLRKRDRVMKKLIPQFGEARLQSRGDAFTTLARSIVGQQISVKAAQSVWDRFAALPPASRRRASRRSGARARRVDACAPPGLSARKVEYLGDLAEHFDVGRGACRASGSRWTTRRSSTNWSPSAASAAGRPRCS